MTKIRIAQYGTQHGNATGKLRAMKTNPHVDVTGVFEPNVERRHQLQNSEEVFSNLHWYESKNEMLADPSILAIASEGRNIESLEQTEDIINASLSDNIGIKHILGEYQSVYDLAKLTNPKVKSIKTPDNLKKILPLNLNLVE